MNTTDRWNHNIHYHPILLAAVRPGGHVLDVGCGEGMLTRALAGTAASVIGIDMHAPSIELARATIANSNCNCNGLAAGDYPRDLLWDIAGAIGTRVHKLNKRYWEHAAMTGAEARDQGRPLCSSNASPSMRSR